MHRLTIEALHQNLLAESGKHRATQPTDSVRECAGLATEHAATGWGLGEGVRVFF